jgi:hypothetical protein
MLKMNFKRHFGCGIGKAYVLSGLKRPVIGVRDALTADNNGVQNVSVKLHKICEEFGDGTTATVFS